MDDNAWRHIETAPTKEMLLLAGTMDHASDWRIKIGYYSADDKRWCIFGASWKPSRWKPLPEMPHASE